MGEEYRGNKYRSLYLITAWSAILATVIIPISIVVYFIWPTFPENVVEIIQQDAFAGLMSLDFTYLVSNIFAIPIFLALYVSLKRVDRGWSVLALVLGLIALVALIPARPITEMFSLAGKLAAASTETQQLVFTAALEATLAQFNGVAYYAHYLLGTISLLISAILMLRSNLYTQAAAWVGIIANVAAFGLIIPGIGVYISILSVFGLMAWWIMMALVYFRLVKA